MTSMEERKLDGDGLESSYLAMPRLKGTLGCAEVLYIISTGFMLHLHLHITPLHSFCRNRFIYIVQLIETLIINATSPLLGGVAYYDSNSVARLGCTARCAGCLFPPLHLIDAGAEVSW